MIATTRDTPQRVTVVRARAGYVMAALLVSLGVMSVMLGVALPVWRTALRREREAELIFRGEQYARAIVLFQRKYAGTFPPSIDVLLQERFLRRRYRDPMTNGDFQLLYVDVPSGTVRQDVGPSAVADGRRGILGVVSRSKEPSLRIYHGRRQYNEWAFVASGVGAQTRQRGPGYRQSSKAATPGDRDKTNAARPNRRDNPRR